MRRILAIIRFITLFLILLPLTFAVRCLVWPTALFSERLDRRLRRVVVQSYMRAFALVAGIKVIIHGHPPKPPFYIVANHVSYIDMLLLTQQTGSIFVSREDVQNWPILGFMAKSIYIIFIDRQDRRDTVRVNKQIEHALAMGDGLAVFAESRISRGLDVEPFKSALIEPAVANNIPVHYATISYETPEGSPPASTIVGVVAARTVFHPHVPDVRILRLHGHHPIRRTTLDRFGPQGTCGPSLGGRAQTVRADEIRLRTGWTTLLAKRWPERMVTLGSPADVDLNPRSG